MHLPWDYLRVISNGGSLFVGELPDVGDISSFVDRISCTPMFYHVLLLIKLCVPPFGCVDFDWKNEISAINHSRWCLIDGGMKVAWYDHENSWICSDHRPFTSPNFFFILLIINLFFDYAYPLAKRWATEMNFICIMWWWQNLPCRAIKLYDII